MASMRMYKKARFKWLRGLAVKLWLVKPKKGWLERFAFPCEHTHTFRHYLPANTQWYSYGKKMGNNDSLVIEGCYLCGKMKVRDWKS